jgi:hypothetical protein
MAQVTKPYLPAYQAQGLYKSQYKKQKQKNNLNHKI